MIFYRSQKGSSGLEIQNAGMLQNSSSSASNLENVPLNNNIKSENLAKIASKIQVNKKIEYEYISN